MRVRASRPSLLFSGGFTLLELVLASAIGAILASAMYGVFSGAMRLREKGQETMDRQIPELAAIRMLRRDLNGITIPSGVLAGAMLGQSIPVNPSQAWYSLTFYTTSGLVSESEPWGEIQMVTYRVAEPETEGASGLNLVRDVTRNLLPANVVEPESQTLLESVSSLQFEYLDPEGLAWTDTWDSTAYEGAPPAAVKVRIEFEPPKEGKPVRQPVELVCEIASQPAVETVEEAAGTATP